MRASASEQVASIGINAVSGQFDRLGWGAVENPRHDLGTDLFVQVRDTRLFDLGLVVGVQVKSGPTWFRERVEATQSGAAGWWFRDRDKRHTDYWLGHGLPHLLVLHDEATGVSYWQHIEPKTVKGTGKGAKVFVPESNTLDESHRDRLTEIAGTSRASATLEGTVWRGVEPPAMRDQVRFALLVPRLMAPHPNASREKPISAAQAIALLMQARVSDIHEYAETFDAVPDLRDASALGDWEWRFVAALAARMLREEVEPLRSALADAPDPASRAAAAVALASGFITAGTAEDALSILDAVIAADDAWPVDDAWLRLQRARALRELGRSDEARADAIEAQRVGKSAPHDVTARAISGVAATLVFDTAAPTEEDLGQGIAGLDTAAAWWRSQAASRGVGAVVDRTYGDWADDQSTYYGPDVANNQLYVAALSASLLGDHGGWRYLQTKLAQDSLLRLDRHAAAAQAADALSSLRRAGDEKKLKLAVRRFLREGPAAAVRGASESMRLARSTRTTIFADLALCEAGGDLFEPAAAAAALEWMRDTLADASTFARLTASRVFLHEAAIVEAMRGLADVEPESVVEAVSDRAPTLGSETKVLLRDAWTRLIYAIPPGTWSAESAALLASCADPHDKGLGLAALGVFARFDSAAREVLVKAVSEGSLRALGAFGPVTELPNDVVPNVFAGLDAELDRRRSDARGQTFHHYADDAGSALVLMLAWHPNGAGLRTLNAYLRDDAVPRSMKRGTIAGIVDHFHQFDEPTRAELGASVRQAASATSGLDRAPSSDPDVTAEAACVAAMLHADDKTETGHVLAGLLSGSPRHRRWAAVLARASEQDSGVGVLASLAFDEDAQVRSWAAALLTRLLTTRDAGPLVDAVVTEAARETGQFVPLAIAETLSEAPTLPLVGVEILQAFRDHPSARVRRAARKGLESAGPAPAIDGSSVADRPSA
jgi:hypothetical protein